MGGQNRVSRLATAAWSRRNPEIVLEHPDREIPHVELNLRKVPRYLIDQGRLVIDKRVHGITGRPWITAASKALLESTLQPTHVGIEFGAGGSTEWFSQRVAHVYSVDAFRHWHDALAERLAQQGVGNVDLVLACAEELGYESAAHRDAYVNAHPQLGPESVDFVFVDGEYRDDAALRGLKLLRPGGLFVLDNANAYLRSPVSRSPWQVHKPASAKWAQFQGEVDDWDHTWTTNGVWDTAIWIKPL